VKRSANQKLGKTSRGVGGRAAKVATVKDVGSGKALSGSVSQPKARASSANQPKASSALASPKTLSRSASAVRVEAKALAQTAKREQARLEGAGRAQSDPIPRDELLVLFREFNKSLEWMAASLAAPPGVPVEQAAERLGVTGTTVRKWLRLGLIEAVPKASPQRISDDSLLALEDVFARVRETFPERAWPKALAAYLHDRELLGQEWAKAGVDALGKGRVVTLAE